MTLHQTSVLKTFTDYFDANKPRFIKEFSQFLNFQTISAEFEEKKDHFYHCVAWLQDFLIKIGFEVSVYNKDPVTGDELPPLLFAEKKSSNPHAKTLFIYNHYDVQPVDPIHEWTHDPFNPFVDDKGTIWARGAQDNKGQCFYVLKALEKLAESGDCGINIKLLIEGEEESGSALLSSLLSSIGKRCKSDWAMIVDMGMEEPDLPAITFGARGLVALTVTMRGTRTDLHSGVHGGLAFNPLHALVQVLASLRDSETGKITIDHFYDDIALLSEEEKNSLYQLKDSIWKKECDSIPSGGEKGLSLTERNWLRPTLEINGIHGGYGGAGAKTVIPKEAIAKITCRLVPNQNPMKVAYAVKKAIEDRCPEGIQVDVEIHDGMGSAIRSDLSSTLAHLLTQTMEEIWQKKPSFVLSGGSIPVLSILEKYLGGDLVLWGVGLNSDNIHAPDEHFDLHRMQQGFLAVCLLVEKLKKKS